MNSNPEKPWNIKCYQNTKIVRKIRKAIKKNIAFVKKLGYIYFYRENKWMMIADFRLISLEYSRMFLKTILLSIYNKKGLDSF